MQWACFPSLPEYRSGLPKRFRAILLANSNLKDLRGTVTPGLKDLDSNPWSLPAVSRATALQRLRGFMRRLQSIALAQQFRQSLHLPPYLNRFAGGRVVLGVVQVQKVAKCRGDLVLVDGFSVPPFAAQRAVGADERHPDVLRLGNFVAVIRPVLWRGAAPVIYGDDDRGLSFVPLVRLQVIPQLAQITVKAIQRVERLVVAPVVRPVIGLVERDVEGARLVAFQMRHCETERVVIVTHAVPGRRRLVLQPAEQFDLRVGVIVWLR